MLINGVDISTLNARQWNIDIGSPSISAAEWVNTDVAHIFSGSKTGLRSIKVSVLVYGSSREEIWNKSNQIIWMLKGISDVRFNGFGYSFRCSMQEASQEEPTKERFHKLTLKLMGFWHDTEMVSIVKDSDFSMTDTSGVTTSTWKRIDNPGNIESPVIIELFNPTEGFKGFNIEFRGLINRSGESYWKSLNFGKWELINGVYEFVGPKYGKKVIINGETGECLLYSSQDHSLSGLSYLDTLSLPSLLPGNNDITMWRRKEYEGFDIKIRYEPRYL